MLKAYVIGRLVKKPELQKTKNDKSICEFDIAATNRGNDDQVNYLAVVVSGVMAENVVKYLDKGSKVAVSGDLLIERYERQDKSKGTSVKIQFPENVEFLDGKKGAANDAADSADDGATADESLPY
ncbi:MAG: single-stranded DNA-binding protein [Clostridia bacterium]|nr:single-stranded DNA-binding protein [Clostridia bacterium]